MTMLKNLIAGYVVCEQREWEAIKAERPGYRNLLHAGLKTEQEAERMARGTAGDDYGRQRRSSRAKKAAHPDIPFLLTTSSHS
jgi:hypothetical protein